MKNSERSPDLWNGLADSYDSQRPDQSLTDPEVRASWQQLFDSHLLNDKCTILDVGCGTGTLALLLAENGHELTGIDFAPQMVAEAKRKAKTLGRDITFDLQDAAAPNFTPLSFDVIICRQVLWTLPDAKSALNNWENLLKPGGIMLIIEGLFASGKGMPADEVVAAMPRIITDITTIDLGTNTSLWAGTIDDDRYLVVAKKK